MRIIKRLKEPTPRFFRKIRNAGMTVTGIAGVVLASPVALPQTLVEIAGYLAVAGAVASTVSQSATISDDEEQWRNEVTDIED